MKSSKLKIPLSQVRFLADEWVWNARNKKILFEKIEGYTYEELAEKYNLTPQRIKNIVKECIDIIMDHK